MFRLARGIGLLAILGLSVTAAYASTPSPANSTVPGVVMVPMTPPGQFAELVSGGEGTLAVAKLAFVIRDAAMSPIPNATITINFGGCRGGDLRFGTPTGQAGINIDCATNTLTMTTGSNGQTDFNMFGYAINPGGGAAGIVSRCATMIVTVPGQPATVYPNINFAASDQNNGGGVNPADGGLFLADRDAIPSPKNQARSDFNGNGTVNPADGSIMLQHIAGNMNASWGGSICSPP